MDADSGLRILWSRSCTQIKTVRVFIDSLTDEVKNKLPFKLAFVYAQNISRIVVNQAHLDHLKTFEWSALVSNIILIQKQSLSFQKLESVRITTELLRSLARLLSNYQSVDITMLQTVVDLLLTLPLDEETTYILHLIESCRHLLIMTQNEAPTIAEIAHNCRSICSRLLSIGDIRNPDARREMMAFWISSNEPVSQVYTPGLIKLVSHSLVNSNDVEFGGTGIAWSDCPVFAARSFADLAPFVGSHILAKAIHAPRAFDVSAKRVCHLSPTLEYAVSLFPHGELAVIQSLIFLKPAILLSNADVEFLIGEMDTTIKDFWILTLLAARGLESLPRTQFKRLWSMCLDRLPSQWSSAACYCLCRTVELLIKITNTKTGVASLLDLIWQLSGVPLTSGSFSLYLKLMHLNVLDPEFCQLRTTRLQNWFATAWRDYLSGSTLNRFRYPTVVFNYMKRKKVKNVYSGYWTTVRAQHNSLSLQTSDSSNSSIDTWDDIPLLSCEPLQATSITPCREARLVYALFFESEVSWDHESEEPVDEPLKDELEAYIWFSQFVDEELIHKPFFRQIIEETQNWQTQGSLGELFSRARAKGKEMNIASYSSFMAFDFDTLQDATLASRAIHFVGCKLLQSYSHQRYLPFLLKLIQVLKLPINRGLDESQELVEYLFRVSFLQSSLSELRTEIATLVTNERQLIDLINTSSDTITAKIFGHLRIDQKLDGSDVEFLESILQCVNCRSTSLQRQLFISLADNRNDVASIIDAIIRNGKYNLVKEVLLKLGKPDGSAVVSILSLLFRYWSKHNSVEEFPFKELGIHNLYSLSLCFPFGADYPSQLAFLPSGLVNVSLYVSSKLKSQNEIQKTHEPEINGPKPRDIVFLCLKLIELTRVDSCDWTSFPKPLETQAVFASYPSELNFLNTESYHWIIEELLLQVSEFSPVHFRYLRIRQVYMLFNHFVFDFAACRAFILGMVLIYCDELHNVYDHLLMLVEPKIHLDIFAEALSLSSTSLRKTILRSMANKPEVSGYSNIIMTGADFQWNEKSLNEVISGSTSRNFGLNKCLFERLFEHLENTSDTSMFNLILTKASKYASTLIQWYRILEIDSTKLPALMGKLGALIPKSINHPHNLKYKPSNWFMALYTNMKSLLLTSDYKKEREITRVIRRFAQVHEGEVWEQSKLDNVGYEFLPPDLWNLNPFDECIFGIDNEYLFGSNELEIFAITMFDVAAKMLCLPSLKSCFRSLKKNLAELLEIVFGGLIYEQKISPEFESFLSKALTFSSENVQRLALQLINIGYSTGWWFSDPLLAVKCCCDLKYGDIGLYALETNYQDGWPQDAEIFNKLEILYKSVEDPDIMYALREQNVSLSTNPSASFLSRSQKLMLAVASYESNGCGSDVLQQAFQQAGLTRMAYDTGIHDLSDYKWPWLLEEWRLPLCPNPRTPYEILFNFFNCSDPQSNIAKAYSAAWRAGQPDIMTIIHDLEAIIAQPRRALDVRRASDFERPARDARRLILERQSDKVPLIMELSSVSRELTAQGRLVESMGCLIRLEKLSKRLKGTEQQIAKLLYGIEKSHIQWKEGDQREAVRTLTHSYELIRDDCQDVTVLAPNYTKIRVVCELAERSYEIRQAPSSDIIKNYLEPEIKLVSSASDADAELLYHTYGVFLNDELRLRIAELEKAQRAYTTSEKNAAYLRKLFEANVVASEEESMKRLRNSSQALYNADKHEVQRLKLSVKRYREVTIKSFLKGMIHGSKFSTLDGGRIIALWLSEDGDFASIIVKENAFHVPSYRFVPWINQLVSRVSEVKAGMKEHATCLQSTLNQLVCHIAENHPWHSLWQLMVLQTARNGDTQRDMDREKGGNQLWLLLQPIILKNRSFDINTMLKFRDNAGWLSQKVRELKQSRQVASALRLSQLKKRSCQQFWRSIKTLNIPLPTLKMSLDPTGTYADVPRIEFVEQSIKIASGLSSPAIVHVVLSNGAQQAMLLKSGTDDLRQDAIMEQVFERANEYLATSEEARHRGLNIRTYKIVPLADRLGAIEFIANTHSFIQTVEPYHAKRDRQGWTYSRARLTMQTARKTGKYAERLQAYDLISLNVKPVLRLYFLQNYKNPKKWLAVRTRYTRSTAVISIVGYILGLGDRHGSNILLDQDTGEVVHIDLGIAFDEGKRLRVPETVPFRLTRDVVDGMGANGVKGVFTRCAEITLDVLRNHCEDILTVLDVLRYDPLWVWRIPRVKSQRIQEELEIYTDDELLQGSGSAERVLVEVQHKLETRLNSDAVVSELIQQASSSENLALMFEGWSPFY